jgi:hypothetical protein
MPFEYSCFISYRHPKYKQARSYTEQIVEVLKGELEMRVTQEVFQDTERLRGGAFYNEGLASALCRSVCMITLYWPTYFSRDHTFCSREYKAMERLEQHRLQLLQDVTERLKGLIIVIALLDFNSIPSEIRDRRQCYDFEPYTLRGDMRQNPEFRAKIREIGNYIAERCQVLESLAREHDVCSSCDSFMLPNDAEILPWLIQVRHQGAPYPNREADR